MIMALLLALPHFLVAQETIVSTIMHDGQERDYRLRIPPGAEAEARPLVFNLHGFGSNAFQQEAYSQMNPVADTAGFYVCYPNGINDAWNVGWAFGSTADDVGFISALIDSLSAIYNIDPSRVYSCGMSNGGFMSYRLACELNGRIAAVASVTGSMVPGYIGGCNPGRAVPVLEIHGTEDPTVPYEGQPLLAVSIEDLLAFWVDNNGCNEPPVIEELPDTDMTDGSTVTEIRYADCPNGMEVLHYRINGGAHTWPSALIELGVTNQDLHGSEAIWHFFNRYTLAGSVSVKGVAAPALRPFPNPTAGKVFLDLPVRPGQVSVFNAAGLRLQQFSNGGGAVMLDLSAYPAGIYWIRVAQGRQSWAAKVVRR